MHRVFFLFIKYTCRFFCPLLQTRSFLKRPRRNPSMARLVKHLEGSLIGDLVFCPYTDYANELYARSLFGTITEGKMLQLTFYEALYLLERGNLSVTRKKTLLSFDALLAVAQRHQRRFFTLYCVFRDLRRKGYIVKTALKFGAEFRVYEKGVRPGEDHAKWIVFPVDEKETQTWYEFSAKNRVAHSTKKRLLIAVVDAESDVTYYEVDWIKP